MITGRWQKAAPGRVPQMSSEMYNRLVDVALGQKLNLPGQTVAERFRQQDIVWVRNDSGADVARFGVLGLGDPVILPADNLDQFKEEFSFSGVTPVYPTHRGRFAVMLDPAPAGGYGRGAISGIVQVQINGVTVNGQRAEIGGDTFQLYQQDKGSAFVLWVENSGNVGAAQPRWAIVRLNDQPIDPPAASVSYFNKFLAAGTTVDYDPSSFLDPNCTWLDITCSTAGASIVLDGIFDPEVDSPERIVTLYIRNMPQGFLGNLTILTRANCTHPGSGPQTPASANVTLNPGDVAQLIWPCFGFGEYAENWFMFSVSRY